jgi:phosphotransferase system HPr-like phosphotransfer protein
MLAANKGAKIQIVAEGDDAEEAVNAIVELSKKNFNIDY